MRYASLALRTVTIRFTSSSGISCMSVALCMLDKKCSDTVVGLELLAFVVNRSAMFVKKRSLSLRLVSPMYCL